MADEDVEEYELEKLRAEIQQETQMKDMLDQSATELRITVEELEKRYDSIENEGNEWKTRFETQEEMNQQLERTIIMLQDKVEEAKRNLKDAKAAVGRTVSPHTGRPTSKSSKSTGITINISVSGQEAGKSPRDMKTFDDLSDANPAMVKTMEKEKNLLYGQLRDLEWRLDHESKAYHKANDERKQYVIEINSTKDNLDGLRTRHRAAVGVQQREVEDFTRTPRLMGYCDMFRKKNEYWAERFRMSAMSSRLENVSKMCQTEDNSNIPEDQRIIDPRHGPIRKTAAVKNLPTLENT